MKKVVIAAVGKLREGWQREGVAEYAKRLSRFCDFSVVECGESPREDISAEGEGLLRAASGFVIACDGGGKQLCCEEFAELTDKAFLSAPCVTFLVGGSRGLDEKVKKKADAILSFGKITLPHGLFRVVLAEQIYRAFTITAGLPYHK